MPFAIVRDDLTRIRADAVVTSASHRPVVQPGLDSAVHAAAGPELLAAREALGILASGTAAITPAGNLKARYVLHAVVPAWQGGASGEELLLRRCYDEALALAVNNRCASVAFPLLGAGAGGFPRERALAVANEAFRVFLSAREMEILLVVYDRDSYRLTARAGAVAAYIDDHYVSAHPAAVPRQRRREPLPPMAGCTMAVPMEAADAAPPPNLDSLLSHLDAGFSDTLLALIARTGKKDSEIYTRANLSRQHFSKIRNNPHYQPTKSTALALAIALELSLEQTEDLIGRAGYALTASSKADIIVRYYIEQGCYDLFAINETLFDFDQKLLGI